MRSLFFKLVLFLILVSAVVTKASGQDAAAILYKMDQIGFSPKDKQGKVAIILIDKSGKEKAREAMMYQKGPDKKLYRYTKPESQAGIATLTLPNSVMWLYMPAFGKPKKISMLTKDSAFNNTDFSYEDMATTPFADRFIPELVETRADVFILILQPKADKSNYSKILVRVNKIHGYAEFMEYYDVTGKKFKEATYSYEKVGQYWNAKEVVMKDLEKNHSTKILITDVKFNQGLSDDLFLVEKMNTGDTKKGN
jgi:outer membrane lipoprotein-sorting protein